MRDRFGLSAQAAVRRIADVADILKVGSQQTRRRFHRDAAQPYDAPIFRFLSAGHDLDLDPARPHPHPVRLQGPTARIAPSAKGEVDMMFVRGKWPWSVAYDLPDQPMVGIMGTISVDQGLVNPAVDDRRASFSDDENAKVRRRGHGRWRVLQKERTRSTTGALRHASGRQARFQRHTGRVTAKAIVADAERDRCTIALEGLAGIRDRVQANRHQLARMANRGFAELRSLIEYKAALKGIPVVLIHPQYISQQCACSGLIDRRNRPNRDRFRFIGRGFAAPADYSAALVIRRCGTRASSFVMALGGTAPGLLLVSRRESRLLWLTVRYDVHPSTRTS